jgi:hypothetical protein
VVAGTNQSLKKFGNPNKQLNGSTSDSGAGTPESYANACTKVGIWHEQGMSDSCGAHDIQSVFRLVMIQIVGEGGLDSRNAIQLLHTVLSLPCPEIQVEESCRVSMEKNTRKRYSECYEKITTNCDEIQS